MTHDEDRLSPEEMVLKMMEDHARRVPSPQIILMSGSEWKAFHDACKTAGVDPEGQYWNWRMRIGAFLP